MIIVRTSGGIGNQLFQYALGRALSQRNSDELRLDTHFYDLNIEPDRSFKLRHFNANAPIATPEDFKKAGIPFPSRQGLFAKAWRNAYRALDSMKPLQKRKVILEPDFGFHPEILEIKGDAYLSGVWQSEKYFTDYAEQIRKDFQLAKPLGKTSESLAQEIRSAGAGSISLHVRRGDQVRDPALLTKHGALTEDYYAGAVAYIAKHVPSPHIFVFSDEIAWCKENLKFNMPMTFINGIDYEDMHLMSLCASHIIAKSSFSWWGAWLDPRPDKIVIAPKQRFGNASWQAPDLLPDSWIKL